VTIARSSTVFLAGLVLITVAGFLLAVEIV
jgi:hypothetical protein